MKVGLLSCTSMKQSHRCKASEMYQKSPRFALAYQYAKKTCEVVYILSAKYGLIHENTIIEPYNETLNEKTDRERMNWAQNVLFDLKKVQSLKDDEFLIIAGMKYCQFLLPAIHHYERPLAGVSLGNWVPVLQKLIDNLDQNRAGDICEQLHVYFNGMPRLSWRDIEQIPFENGIYIMFEKGENYKGLDRIVRVGTHVSNNRLKLRLRNHYLTENKDGSILRKNIGLALLNKEKNPYLDIWNLDISKPEAIAIYAGKINHDYQARIERQVTQYLQNNITFVCIQVDDPSLRLRLEEGLISTLAHSVDFYASDQWLGRLNPKQKLANSSLWNIQGLDARPLSDDELLMLLSSNHRPLNKYPDRIQIAPQPVSYKVRPIEVQTVTGARHSTAEIRDYIVTLLTKSKENGKPYIDLVSGQIHRELRLKNSMPSVCHAMRQVKKAGDTVLKTTSSGNSSTITIRYYL